MQMTNSMWKGAPPFDHMWSNPRLSVKKKKGVLVCSFSTIGWDDC